MKQFRGHVRNFNPSSFVKTASGQRFCSSSSGEHEASEKRALQWPARKELA